MSDWHESYKKHYEEAKKAGKSFFPHAVFKDTLVAFLILVALLVVGHFIGAKLEDLADPTDSTYNPRPEWYFLPLFQALKLFPGKLEAVAALGVPGLLFGILILAPILDKGPERHPFRRPIWTGLGVATLIGLGALMWAGLRSPMINPIVAKNPLVEQGLRLYRDLKCSYCHSINGEGGHVGPDLAKLGQVHDDAWLTKHFRDPQALYPTSQMPKLNLLDEEITALVAYIQSMNVVEKFSGQAPKLFEQNCSVCHKLGTEGGEVGPDLTTIGSLHDRAYIERYTSDPTKMNPDSTMPAYKDHMKDQDIEDIARYLASFKDKK